MAGDGLRRARAFETDSGLKQEILMMIEKAQPWTCCPPDPPGGGGDTQGPKTLDSKGLEDPSDDDPAQVPNK